ncbi:MAG: hypothetical protein GQ532_09945 [Methylomarinum sp.]|nr:hypothetical protein [Methylomarinum sp.]
MRILSDEKLNYWAVIYQQLDRQYDLFFKHPDMSFEQFLDNPKTNERWIKVYMANPMLFVNRYQGAVVLLSVFLENGPQFILAGLLAREQSNQDESLEYLPPLQKQVLCTLKFAQTDTQYLQDCYENYYWKRRGQDLEIHGDQLTQPIHHRAVPKKYKTGGLHHA